MKRAKFLFTVSFFLFFASMSYADEDKDQLLAANAFYEQKAYENAIGEYLKVVEGGYQSKAVFNNLGSSYFKSGDLPKSILYFEKGLKIDPFDKNLQHNLNISREQLDNEIIQIPEFIVARFWKYLFTRASSNTWYMLAFLIALIGVFTFGVWLLNSSRTHKKRGFFAAITCFVLCLLLFSLSSSQAKWQYKVQSAIVMERDVLLKSAPEEANDPILTLIPGTKLMIIDQIGNYDKVRLENGQIGWVQKGGYTSI